MLAHVIIPILTILVSPFGYRAVVCLRRNIRAFRLLVEAPRVPLLGILAGELLAEATRCTRDENP